MNTQEKTNCIDRFLALYNRLDENDRAEIRAEAKLMLKADKYNKPKSVPYLKVIKS